MGFGLGSVIGAVGSIAGGLLGKSGQENAAEINTAMQKEFAQNGVRWKVDDAKAAGIHPLYALGANTTSYQPNSIGNPLGSALADAGQDIGRAIDAGSTTQEKVATRLGALSIDRAELENDLLRSQIAKINQPGSGPGIPVAGSGHQLLSGSNDVVQVPKELVRSVNGVEPGRGPAHQVMDFGDGDMVRIPAGDFAQAIEDTPAHWYYTSSRTLPDMAWSDIKYVARRAASRLRSLSRYHSSAY